MASVSLVSRASRVGIGRRQADNPHRAAPTRLEPPHPADPGGPMFLAWREMLFARTRFLLMGLVLALMSIL
ncbi:MAG TPA: hypothetical protein K8V57_06935, partial [Corynebacterium xerosis]|uniref:hypothetical protein n=1 Tax=Corynebacterium xerosis TaxID=1725 RepID=UPI001E11605C